jgi:dephospho-CoA kinase
MILIGLTGILGSGKSTVAALLKKNGLDVIDLDALAKESLNRKETQSDIRRTFGEEYIVEGRVDVERLRRIAFAKGNELKKLEAIIHPRVIQEVERRLDELEKKGVRSAVIDHPLLFETGFYRKVDRKVVVSADMVTIRERLIKRGMTTDDVERRFSFQIPLSQKEKMADYVIDNNGTEDQLKMGVGSLMEKITKWEVEEHASK